MWLYHMSKVYIQYVLYYCNVVHVCCVLTCLCWYISMYFEHTALLFIYGFLLILNNTMTEYYQILAYQNTEYWILAYQNFIMLLFACLLVFIWYLFNLSVKCRNIIEIHSLFWFFMVVPWGDYGFVIVMGIHHDPYISRSCYYALQVTSVEDWTSLNWPSNIFNIVNYFHD